MYKFVVLLAIALVAVNSFPAGPAAEPVAILKSESDFEPEGSYTFSFEAADGSAREEKGVVMNAGQEDAFVAITGMYRYVDADGQNIEVHYTADEKGFIPSGTNIPSSIEKAARAAGEGEHKS